MSNKKWDKDHQKWIDGNGNLPFYIWIEKATGYYKVVKCEDYPTAKKTYKELMPKKTPVIHTTLCIMNYQDTINRLNAKQLETNLRRPENQWV